MKKKQDRGRIRIIEDLCKGCGMCVEACPPNALQMADRLNRLGYHPAEYAGFGCTGCGICFYRCPEPGTLTVFRLVERIAV